MISSRGHQDARTAGDDLWVLAAGPGATEAFLTAPMCHLPLSPQALEGAKPRLNATAE